MHELQLQRTNVSITYETNRSACEEDERSEILRFTGAEMASTTPTMTTNVARFWTARMLVHMCAVLFSTPTHICEQKWKEKKKRCGKKSLRERKIQNLHAWNSQHVIFPATNDELFERIQFAENGKIKSDDDGVGVTVDIVVTNPRMMVLNLLRLFGGKRKTEGKRN